ncbi:MAG: integral rane sensor signal transduction histidine kinase [Firmicutes bacterium]|nr:integral rane sensor signal transduction histidine kinase [Bacillota bacterium]
MHILSRYRFFISILMGSLCFLELYFPIHYSVLDFELNITWSRIFPLLVALAWGPRYGIVSLTLGLAGIVYWLRWVPAGWNAILIMGYYTLWIVIHGWCADRRGENSHWRYNVFVVQILFSILNVFLILVVYPFIAQYNPAPWMRIGYMEPIPASLSGLFAVKSVVNELLIVAMADVLLLLPFLRKRFRLPVMPQQRHNGTVLTAFVGFSCVFTVISYGACELLSVGDYALNWLFSATQRFRVAMAMAVILGSIFGGIGIRFLQRKLEADDALRRSEEKWRILFESVQDIYMETTLDGIITMVSPSIEKLLGYSPAEVIGKDSAKICADPEDRDRVVHQYRVYGTTTNSEIELKDRTGNSHWMTLSAIRKTAENGSRKIIAVARDITDLKVALDEIQKMNLRLEQRVEERTRELESFTYTVSHDLKAPVRAIEGYSQFIQEDFGDHMERDALAMVNKIHGISQDMIEMVDKLLEYVTTTKMEITWEAVDMRRLAETVFDELRMACPERSVLLELGEELPSVSGDRILMRQVLTNLLSNAFKFTKDRNPAKIKVECYQIKSEYVFSIQDNGIGFDMEYAHKLYDIFQRLHTREEYEGFGIGLATVRHLVEKHGGRTWIQGNPGVGTIVFFTLPA